MTPAPQPYPTYKPSGVPWLGNVPEHWEVRRLKTVCRLAYGNSLPADARSDGAVPVYGSNGPVGMHIAANTEAPCIVVGRKGSFGKIHFSARPVFAIDTTYYVDERHSTANLAWLSRVLGWLRLDAVTRDSAVPGLSREETYDRSLPLPPLPEQAAIVRYLDHADRRIRRYVSAKRKLIALLEEEKQAIINRAVTRGLDPNVRLKPSGVEWLGDVPAHWEVTALRNRFSQNLGKMLDTKRITGDHLLPYLRNTDIQWDHINVEDLPTMDIPPSQYDRYTVRRDDLLVCEGGEVGRSALWSEELTICGFQKALHRLRPRNAEQDMPRFMYYALRVGAKGYAFSDGHVSTIAHLTGDKLRAHRFPFPPLAEQTAIVEYLNRATADIDAAIARARRQVELIQEYRKRLIADVVTGKLDVREAAAQLPDETDDQDPIEEGGPLADGVAEDLHDPDESAEELAIEREVIA